MATRKPTPTQQLISTIQDLQQAILNLDEAFRSSAAAQKLRVPSEGETRTVSTRSLGETPTAEKPEHQSKDALHAKPAASARIGGYNLTGASEAQKLFILQKIIGSNESTVYSNTLGGGPSQTAAPKETPSSSGLQNDEQLLSWSMISHESGPNPVRSLAFRINDRAHTIRWAAQAAEALHNTVSKSVLGDMLSPVTGVLKGMTGTLADSAGIAALGTIGIEDILKNVGHLQQIGGQLGYGAPTGGYTFMGLPNPLAPFSQAARVGASIQALQQSLQGMNLNQGFGSGLTSQQAAAVVQGLTQQGFTEAPQGELASAVNNTVGQLPVVGSFIRGIVNMFTNPEGNQTLIAKNFVEPMMLKYGGSANAWLQLDSVLRYANTSMSQLKDTLQGIGEASRAANIPINDFLNQINQIGQTFQQMGGSPQAGMAIGMTTTSDTGLPPTLAVTAAQNSLFQGYMTGQYGVIPSGLTSLSPGSYVGGMLGFLQLIQKATAGFGHNVYGKNGVLLSSAYQQQLGLESQLTGFSPQYIRQMENDIKGQEARAYLSEYMGSAANSTGIWHWINAHGQTSAADYAKASAAWNEDIAPFWKNSGLTRGEMQRLSHISNMRDRLNALSNDIIKATHNDKWNQIYNNPNVATVQVEFTGLAAKFFRQAPSMAQQIANAGGPQMNSIINHLGYSHYPTLPR